MTAQAPKAPAGQIVGFDLTIPAETSEGIPEVWDKNQVMEFLHEWGKKWVFQLERGSEQGKLHFQIRLHLMVKRRLTEIVKITTNPAERLVPLGSHWSPTCTTVHTGQNFNYVQKADTRVEGPWKDTDYEEPPPLTEQLKEFMTFQKRPYQVQIENMMEQLDFRTINLIYDTIGNVGKSIFCEYLEYQGLAFEMPAFREMEDIMQCIMGVKTKRNYIIDMPRAMKKDKLASFFAGIESLKNGVAFEKRYAFKKKRFTRPNIFVFTNTLPDWNLLSRDRWKVWKMTSNYELESLDVPRQG